MYTNYSTSITPLKKTIEKGLGIRLVWHISSIFYAEILPVAHTIKMQQGYIHVLCTFSTRDESVDDDLCTIEEVSKLGLPDGQVVRTLHAETILKTKHRLFTQGTVSNLK